MEQVINRKNRGKSSEDDSLFAPLKEQLKLQSATEDLYFLLSRGYTMKSALPLVAGRYRLRSRQLPVLQGMCCSKQNLIIRKNKELSASSIKGKNVYVDGFNILILMESLLSNAYLFKGIDGCYRDISAIHGTYKMVNQTETALIEIGKALESLGVKDVTWVFNSPVSNSGKIKQLCHRISDQYDFRWEILLEYAPDKFLSNSQNAVVTSDAEVLDQCQSWYNLCGYYIENKFDNLYPENILTATISEIVAL